ncbi:MAG TPA: hypothetical protein VE959_22580 [Bryobacteraceae bacterium]|nr:hypothetical protein [Bryobacteraceae bacterium]
MRRLLVFAALFFSACAQTTAILSVDQIRQLETTVAQNPADRHSQTLLGRNYAFVILGVTALGQGDMVTGVDPAKAHGDFAQHARDEMAKTRFAGVAGEGGQALWNRAIQVDGYLGYQVVQRLTDQVPVSDARALGVQALDRAISLEPDNPQWRTYRIPITESRSNFNKVMPLSAGDAYSLVKQDISALKGTSRYYVLAVAAKLAVRASALDDARGYGQELLQSATGPKDWNFGNAVFFGNMVLGQVALRQGNIDSARSYLLASGKTPGSPQLNSFGPNMSLARDLIESGQREAVVSFFDECRAFWKLDRGKLQQWSEQVNSGHVPDFGTNLLY